MGGGKTGFEMDLMQEAGKQNGQERKKGQRTGFIKTVQTSPIREKMRVEEIIQAERKALIL